MSIFNTVRDLIKGSPDAETATRHLMEVLAREAIKTGDPDALVSVAVQWQELLEGRPSIQRPLAAAAPTTLAPALPAPRITRQADLHDHVLEVMRVAYLSGYTEVTTGTIQKGVDRLVRSGPGWTDADLEGSSEGINWKLTLSACLKDMRRLGEVRNPDIRQWKTYVLAPHMLPALPAAPKPAALEPSWEFVQMEAA